MTANSALRQDVYSRVTDKIIKALETGTRPWAQPWNAEHAAGRICRPLRSTFEPYRGINILMLWAEAAERGYAAPIWITVQAGTRAWRACAQGRKRRALVVYANSITRTEQNDAGEEIDHTIPFLKGYTVFNVEQVEGLPAHFYALAQPPAPREEIARISHAEAFLESTGAQVVHGGNVASYNVALDCIRMPQLETFRDAASYYSVRCHEAVHWTRHKSRLDRSFGCESFGDEGYAREELVAELGSCFICADLALTPELRDDHASYLACWLKVLKRDKRAIFQAAAHAQRAADYLHSLQPAAAPEAQAA